ncbi:MAG: hypothetical protein KF745_05385 [Phycisphaeraceae bacterium]|nr:hypothetical protein [Phycisphaeraceae bacterium]
MARVDLHLPQVQRLGETSRVDSWWVQPAAVFAGLMGFIVYSTWAAFQGAHYSYSGGGAEYLSPFYSPLLWEAPGQASGHAWFGAAPGWLLKIWPAFIPFSPALLILWAPGGFRFTCYYYRGAYYKAFWADPLNCAVGEPGFRGKKYRGERKLPLILQNVHRYFLYLALGFLVILAWDAMKAYWFHGAPGSAGGEGGRFGIGVGSLVLTINPILLGGYTLGCHSLRHLVGGRCDEIGEGARRSAYECVTCLNKRHMLWAWMSLVWVGFTDLYVRMCSMGVWHDYRIL